MGQPATHRFDTDATRRRLVVRTGIALAVVASVVGSATLYSFGPLSGAGRSASGDPSTSARRGTVLETGATMPSRALYGWGDNDSGQIGIGSLGGGSATGIAAPATVNAPAGTAFASVAAGGASTVGLTTTGQVYAWGSNSVGQLGDGSTSSTTSPIAVSVPNGPVTAIAAGSSHALALTATGAVYAWGANVFGQIGNTTTASALVPVAVSTPAGVTFTAVAAGGDHSMALSSTGVVFAWGANTHGELGNGTTTSISTPVAITAPTGVQFTAIAAGTGHSLALGTDGQVYAWGFNASGQLGNGLNSDSLTPILASLPAGTTISSIAAGGSHSLALSATGTVLAWGSNVFGQLASPLVGSNPVDSAIPAVPTGLPPATAFVSIAAGEHSSYALTSVGVPWVWGGDYYGQLGDGTPGLTASPPEAMATLPVGTLVTGVYAGANATSAFLLTRAEQSITYPALPGLTYGDRPVDVAPSVDSGLSLANSSSGACTGPAVRLVIVSIGTCTLTTSQDGSFQYYPATATATFEVAPATLEIHADPVTASAGAALPKFGYHLTGFKNGDTVSVVSGTPSCTSTATPESGKGTYDVTCAPGSLTAANYVFAAAGVNKLTLLGSATGYAAFGTDGSITPIGPVPTVNGVTTGDFGSMAGHPLVAPVVGAAFTPNHDGYWMVASDGGVFSFGSATYLGSMGGHPLNTPIVAFAATPTGAGYWEVSADGGIFSFGDAGYYGSTGAQPLSAPIVGMAPTGDGLGYWLIASDGGVFGYGDAGFYGAPVGRTSVDPVVGLAPTANGRGYWLVTRAGAVLPFGNAVYQGSLRFIFIGAPIVGITASPDGHGYWMAGEDGGIFSFGGAPFYGSVSNPSAPIAGII